MRLRSITRRLLPDYSDERQRLMREADRRFWAQQQQQFQKGKR